MTTPESRAAAALESAADALRTIGHSVDAAVDALRAIGHSVDAAIDALRTIGPAVDVGVNALLSASAALRESNAGIRVCPRCGAELETADISL